MDMVVVGFIAFISYAVIGRAIGTSYWRRKHGVYRSFFFSTEAIFTGMFGFLAVGLTWPVSIFIPAVRAPELCTHGSHILERDSARREYEQMEDALRRERGLA